MIVDTISFDEITNYLLKTSFSTSRIIIEVEKKYIYPNRKKYRREIVKWKQNPAREQYKIFNPIVSKGNCHEELVYVPFGVNTDYPDFILFVQFHYRGRKYVAYKLVGNRVMYFSWHSLERYSERFLGDKNLVIDNEFIGDMLIYNSGISRTSYTYKGIPSIMYQQMEVSYVLNIRNVLWSTHLSLKMNTFPTNRNWISQPLKNLKETKKKSMDIG